MRERLTARIRRIIGRWIDDRRLRRRTDPLEPWERELLGCCTATAGGDWHCVATEGHDGPHDWMR